MRLVSWTCLILGGIKLSVFEHVLEARDLIWSFIGYDGGADIIIFCVTFEDESRCYHGFNVLTPGAAND